MNGENEFTMIEENIKLVLQYCSFNYKFFLINKVFERIYTSIIYTDKVIDKIIIVADYENDIELINILKTRQLISYEYENYWNKFKSDQKLIIDWKKLNTFDFYCISSIVNINIKQSNYFNIYKATRSDLEYAHKLLSYFSQMINKFEKRNLLHWSYGNI